MATNTTPASPGQSAASAAPHTALAVRTAVSAGSRAPSARPIADSGADSGQCPRGRSGGHPERTADTGRGHLQVSARTADADTFLSARTLSRTPGADTALSATGRGQRHADTFGGHSRLSAVGNGADTGTTADTASADSISIWKEA